MSIRRFVCLLFLFHVAVFIGYSQKSIENKANDAFLNAQYIDAIKYYEQLIIKDASNYNAIRNLGYAYKYTNQNNKAEPLFKKLLDANMQKNQDVYAYAQVLKQLGKFQDFDIWMKRYAKLNPTDKRVIKYIENPNYIKTLLTDSLNTEISYLDINSEVPEFAPAFYKNKLCFVSARGKKPFLKPNHKYDGGRFLDIYTASILENKELDSITHLPGNINTSMHEGPLCFTNNDSLMYFTRNYFKAKIYNKNNSENKLRIAIAEYTKNGWKQIGFLFKNDLESSYGHPTVSSKGDELIFVSDRPGGYGGTDLYKCTKINGAWSKPQNLGPTINTEGNEMFPFIDSVGTLFFASDGHLGLGGLDIFYSPFVNEKYQLVVNVGVPINSNADDFGLVLSNDLKTGYFSSNRSAGLNDDDLYRFERELGFGVLYSLNGYVYDKYKNTPLNDAILKLFLNDVLIEEKYVDDLGFYQFNLKKDKNYILKVTADDYSEVEMSISTFENKKGALSENIFMEPIKDLVLSGKITDVNTMNSISYATIELYSVYNKLLGVTTSDANGDYFFPVDRSVNYNLKVLKFNYETASLPFTTFRTSGLNKVSQNISLKQVPVIKIKGVVSDATNNLGIPNADVFILSNTDKVLSQFKTDLYGQYLFECQYNVTYRVKILKDGYNEFQTELSTVNLTGLNAIVRNYEIVPVPYFILKGIVTKGDSKMTPLENVHVQIFDVLNSTKNVLDMVTDIYGSFSVKLTDRVLGSIIKFELILSKNGYVSKREVVKIQLNNIGEYNLSETLNLKLDLMQVGNDIGKIADVKSIYFDYGKFNIKEDAALELDKIVKILKDNPSIEIELGSHTDSRSSSKFNQNLSQKRADAAAQYIVSKGVVASRVLAKGYGESKLVNHCKDGVLCSETEHQENRRTEFIILKY